MALYRIREYGKIKSEGDYPEMINTESEIALPDQSFLSIWNYILEFQSKDISIDRAFRLYTKNGKKIIQAQNYVGIIETKDNEVIEILPKIYSDGKEADINVCKNVFLKMIATLKDSPYINIQEASLEVKRNFPILEVFISQFVSEVEYIVLNGMKKGYQRYEANSTFLKGQLMFSKNLLTNLIDNSRFYISYNRFDVNISQNRVIKSALQKVFNISNSRKNKSRIQHLLFTLDEVEKSRNLTADIQACKVKSRLFNGYNKALSWAEIFLINKSFTTFAGQNINQAMLFPMEVLFESYITHLFKKYAHNHVAYKQHNQFYLVNQHRGRGIFSLRPDLYLEGKTNETQCFILDTKWKILDESQRSKNYNISQADMYQLYAYGRKYMKDQREPKLILIYPINKTFNKKLSPFFYETTNGSDHLELTAIPFDILLNSSEQISGILQYLEDSKV